MITALTVTSKGQVTLAGHPGQRLELQDDSEQPRAAMHLLRRAELLE